MFTEHMDEEKRSAFDALLAGDVGDAAYQAPQAAEQKVAESGLMAAFLLPGNRGG